MKVEAHAKDMIESLTFDAKDFLDNLYCGNNSEEEARAVFNEFLSTVLETESTGDFPFN